MKVLAAFQAGFPENESWTLLNFEHLLLMISSRLWWTIILGMSQSFEYLKNCVYLQYENGTSHKNRQVCRHHREHQKLRKTSDWSLKDQKYFASKTQTFLHLWYRLNATGEFWRQRIRPFFFQWTQIWEGTIETKQFLAVRPEACSSRSANFESRSSLKFQSMIWVFEQAWMRNSSKLMPVAACGYSHVSQKCVEIKQDCAAFERGPRLLGRRHEHEPGTASLHWSYAPPGPPLNHRNTRGAAMRWRALTVTMLAIACACSACWMTHHHNIFAPRRLSNFRVVAGRPETDFQL